MTLRTRKRKKKKSSTAPDSTADDNKKKVKVKTREDNADDVIDVTAEVINEQLGMTARTIQGNGPTAHAGRRVTEKRLLVALEDSGGNVKIVAQRLGISRGHCYELLKPDKMTPRVAEAYEYEKDYVADLAEETVKEIISQRLDLGSASRTARWYLERKADKRGYKPNAELTIQGGDKPLHVLNENVLSIDALDLPVTVRKQLLEAMEKKEQLDEGNKE